MKTQKNSHQRQSFKDYRPQTQSDNNAGTFREEGLPHRHEQRPFELQDNIEDLVTGNEEYNRHHKPERDHKKILPVSEEEEKKKGEINPDLPGNRPDNIMITHAEDYDGASS